MRRRPSGSAAEDDDDDDNSPGEAVRPTLTDLPDQGDSRSSSTSARASTSIEGDPGDASHAVSGNASLTWDPSQSSNGSLEKTRAQDTIPLARLTATEKMPKQRIRGRPPIRNPWWCSLLTLATTVLSLLLLGFTIHSFTTRQLDPKGCIMSYMDPLYAKFVDFDTEHTRFASKYSLYLYREKGVDPDTRASRPGCHPKHGLTHRR